MRAVVGWPPSHAGPHAGGAAHHAVEAGVVDHLDDGRHAAALLADHPRPGAPELDLARGVGAVAELVLQALDVESVAPAVGKDAREQEARQAARRLGQHEERVAHRRGAEPFVAGELVLAPGPPPFSGRAEVVLARTSEPPCFSVIAIPQSAPVLSAWKRRGSVVERQEARLPLRGELWLLAGSAGIPEYVIESGQPAPASACRRHEAGGLRATCAPPARGSLHGSEGRPEAAPFAISSCHEGGTATSSMRLPKRSWSLQDRLVLVRLPAPAMRLRLEPASADLRDGPLVPPVGALPLRAFNEDPIGLEGVVGPPAAAAWLRTSWVAVGAFSRLSRAMLVGH